ncbi:MAG TPA: polyketide synthase [Bacillota bacterium]|nr:polyketide synthase [Bacillota bacterium]
MKPIAIIGFYGKFPNSDSMDAFWDNLENQRFCFDRIPEERWSGFARERAVTEEAQNSSFPEQLRGGFLRDLDKFDNTFFGISKKDVYAIDPHQRLFLEAVWGALENGGYGNFKTNKHLRIGLYAAGMWHDFSLCAAADGIDSSLWGIANRASFFFDFSGPSIGVDTACSSALTGIHLACQSLDNDECDMALAGAVNLILHPTRFIYLNRNKYLAPGNPKLCFEPGQEGYIPSEGVGALLLKRLDLAERDRDTIHGVICGSGINHSARGLSYKSPSSEKQADLVERVIQKSGVNLKNISFIEMSAYGGETVDMIELMALYKVFKKVKDQTQFCMLGSLKPFLGHMEATSGIAQVIKILMQLKKKELLPSGIHPSLETTFSLPQTPFQIQHEKSNWISEGKRTAGISCVGGGGSNAFMIIEEYREQQTKLNYNRLNPVVETITGKGVPILFSAASLGQLKQYLGSFRDYLQKNNHLNIVNIGFTLFYGRETMSVRAGFICDTTPELLELIGRNLDTLETGGVYAIASVPEQARNAVEHWRRGGDFCWPVKYSGAQRIPLPGYPYQKSSFPLNHYDGRRIKSFEAHLTLDSVDAIRDHLLELFTRICRPNEILSPSSIIANIIPNFNSLKLLFEELQQQFGELPKNIFSQTKTIAELSIFLAQTGKELEQNGHDTYH